MGCSFSGLNAIYGAVNGAGDVWIRDNRFRIVRQLGEGGAAFVFLVKEVLADPSAGGLARKKSINPSHLSGLLLALIVGLLWLCEVFIWNLMWFVAFWIKVWSSFFCSLDCGFWIKIGVWNVSVCKCHDLRVFLGVRMLRRLCLCVCDCIGKLWDGKSVGI